MIVAHLRTTTFFGGPERQVVGLAEALRDDARSVFLSFPEGGRCAGFLDECRARGFEAEALPSDAPRFRAAVAGLAAKLREVDADVLCTHGYKDDLLGLPAARKARIPIVAVSRGWTGESRKVRVYEALDRLALRAMDRVVGVSEGQARKVLRAGVRPSKVEVIRNAIRADRFGPPDPSARAALEALLGGGPGPIVAAAGRLSPEKGFDVLVEAAAIVAEGRPDARFAHFGDGPLKAELQGRIEALGLAGRFVLAGFRADLDRLLPCLDLVVLPSRSEGLPNVALEGSAAGVAVVATAVGGTPEVVLDGETGLLAPPDDPAALASRIVDLLGDDPRRAAMGRRGRELVASEFTFEAQAARYLGLFRRFTAEAPGAPREEEREEFSEEREGERIS